MRFIQTFWTSGRDPKTHSFGWPSPEFNIISWVLSCLSIRKHYDNLELYTDKEGYSLLIGELNLPYTRVHLIYNERLCLAKNWAYAKIKTYSLQDRPFLHIDGDFYLPHPLRNSILTAPIVAQNRELGASYYEAMLANIRSHQNLAFPQCVMAMYAEKSISSFNMGIFGGHNIEFIQRYCKDAMSFVDENGINNSELAIADLECNLFFEQIVFAAKADYEHEKVFPVWNKTVLDFGYTAQDFCDLDHWDEKDFLHILGGHKRSIHTCKMLANVLIREYPVYFDKIAEIFCKRKKHLTAFDTSAANDRNKKDGTTTHEYVGKHSRISKDEIAAYESSVAWNVKFTNRSVKEQEGFTLSVPPVIKISPVSSLEGRQEIMQKLNCEDNFPLCAVGICPTRLGCHLFEVPLLDTDVDIVEKIKERGSICFMELVNMDFTSQRTKQKLPSDYIAEELQFLVKNGIIIATRTN